MTRRAAAAALLLAAAGAQAQLLDRYEVRRDGADTVLQLVYENEILFQRAITTGEGGLTVVSYELVNTTNQQLRASQSLQLGAKEGLPRLTLADEPEAAPRSRRVVIRLADAGPLEVRAGAGNRTLEIVLRGAAAAAAPAPAPASAPALPVNADADTDAQADTLMAAAQAALARNEPAAALDPLNALLNLPPNRQSQAAQELAGTLRTRLGDPARARAEFETYLRLYPQGEGAERVRRALAALPAPDRAPAEARAPRPAAETTTTGSTSLTYFGGNGQVRNQAFKDSPLAGVPQVAGDPLFSAEKARQLLGDIDLAFRQRDADSDLRFVFRDAYTRDFERPQKSKNRLSSLYVDYKSLAGKWGARLGRQSPTGGGVMGRFDGVSASARLAGKTRVAGVFGEPTDKFFESRRRFFGASVDIDGVLPNVGSNVYAIQQTIDGEIDRRALGLELRYFRDGASVFSQFDHDVLIGGLNIATVQGTLITADNTVYTALYDRRALSMLTLGNALTFEDAANPGVFYTRIADKLATTTLDALRDQVKRTTPYVTQAQLGVTHPVDPTWSVGASVSLTNTGAIPAVPEVAGFENGRPASGNIVSVSGQLIGQNLYSARDTHVVATTVISSPQLHGNLVSYNNSSLAWDVWQVEPSLQFYRDRQGENATSRRWTPGLRITYRGWERWAIESAMTYEIGRATRTAPDPADPSLTVTTRESSTRANYSLGARFSF